MKLVHPSPLGVAIGLALANIIVCQSSASEEIYYFQVPSGNIHCAASSLYGLDCEIGTIAAKIPPRPKDCDLDWGYRFMMSTTGISKRGCYGDTIGRDPKHPVLAYGKMWRSQEFSCLSKRTGLTCQNQSGHGWNLSKGKQQLF